MQFIFHQIWKRAYTLHLLRLNLSRVVALVFILPILVASVCHIFDHSLSILHLYGFQGFWKTWSERVQHFFTRAIFRRQALLHELPWPACKFMPAFLRVPSCQLWPLLMHFTNCGKICRLRFGKVFLHTMSAYCTRANTWKLHYLLLPTMGFI